MYDPESPPAQIAAGIAAAFADKVIVAGVSTALSFEGTRVPRLLPAVQLVPIQVVPSNEEGPLGVTEWTFVWRVDVYLEMKDYIRAQQQLLQLVTSILHLPIKERRLAAETTGGAQETLGGSCDEWSVSDPGDEPDPRDQDEILYKQLVLHAVATTVP